MSRVETLTFRQFFDCDYNTDVVLDKIIQHLKKHKIKYQIVGVTLIIFASGIFDTSVFAAGGTGIDIGGRRIYKKLVSLGKWVIIFKGAWETIQSSLKGDMDTAKKSFLQYLLIYVILLALPWSMDQIDTVFKGI